MAMNLLSPKPLTDSEVVVLGHAREASQGLEPVVDLSGLGGMALEALEH
jgi:hypothetical protein